MLIPGKVLADEIKIDSGECIKEFGTISFEAYDTISQEGKTGFTSTSEIFEEWSTSPRNFMIDIKAAKCQKIQDIEYVIKYDANKSCTGNIKTDLFSKYEVAFVRLSVNIDKKYVRSFNFKGNTMRTKGTCSGWLGSKAETDETVRRNVLISHEETEGQHNEPKYALSDDTLDPFGDNYGAPTNGVGFCEGGLLELIEKYWGWIMFLTPLLLIVMITIDFLKAMASNEAEAISKSSTAALKRTIAAIVLLALPWIIKTLFKMFGIPICF